MVVTLASGLHGAVCVIRPSHTTLSTLAVYVAVCFGVVLCLCVCLLPLFFMLPVSSWKQAIQKEPGRLHKQVQWSEPEQLLLMVMPPISSNCLQLLAFPFLVGVLLGGHGGVFYTAATRQRGHGGEVHWSGKGTNTQRELIDWLAVGLAARVRLVSHTRRSHNIWRARAKL